MTETKKASYYPYIVTFLGKDRVPMRWKPKQPDAGLETAMVPAFQRGGIHGEFQTMDNVRVEYELFIPMTAIHSVETRTSLEKRKAASLARQAAHGEG